MKRLPLLAVLLLPLSTIAAPLFDSPATPQQLQVLLPKSAVALTRKGVLRGNFTQTKTLRDLPKPLRSSGSFLFSRDKGVIWQVVKPFASEFVLTPTVMLTREAGGERRSSAGEQPGLAMATRLFSALFTLDLAALQAEFTVYASGDAKNWMIGLKPRHAAMAATFSEAVVAGGEQVQAVTLTDAQGDKTNIRLSDVRAQAALSAADALRFP